jgi:hypothetical protein
MVLSTPQPELQPEFDFFNHHMPKLARLLSTEATVRYTMSRKLLSILRIQFGDCMIGGLKTHLESQGDGSHQIIATHGMDRKCFMV